MSKERLGPVECLNCRQSNTLQEKNAGINHGNAEVRPHIKEEKVLRRKEIKIDILEVYRNQEQVNRHRYTEKPHLRLQLIIEIL